MKTFNELKKQLEEKTNNTRMAYHGSPNVFTKFKTNEVFLAKDPKESLTYGKHLYEITFKGKPLFETPTIMVIKNSQVTDIKKIK